MIKKTTHFIDSLSTASIQAPQENFVSVQPFTIQRETRMAIFNHPPSSVTYENIKLGLNPILCFGIGIKQACWKQIQSTVYFVITIMDEKGCKKKVFEESLSPSQREQDCCWKNHKIDLKKYQNRAITISFETYTKWRQDSNWCWAGWSDPCLEELIEPPTSTIHSMEHPLILFITTDALRADYLPCYGHPHVQAPYIDQLVQESALFKHARVQSPTTLGSYASLLSGLYPTQHGINNEWGMFSTDNQSLPLFLKSHGFHTVFAPSEEELNRKSCQFVDHFDELIPTRAIPAQDGSITTRQITQWLEKPLKGPTFIWAQYFDTHPPHTSPPPFNSLYYTNNDPATHTYQPDWVAKIRGVESLLELNNLYETINQGYIPYPLYERLKATARIFNNTQSDGPDLADHLKALGPKSYLNMTPLAFSEWLDQEADSLLTDHPSKTLLDWLEELREDLIRIDHEIVSWLDGVTDFHFPHSQYKSSVTYFDHQVGQLIETLKRQNLYDQTLIIITSPHGEVLNEHGIFYHHHVLTEEVCRIPLIIKPCSGQEPRQIGGIFDSIDLFPTLAEALELPVPEQLPGTSRWKHVLSGDDIPPHDSITIDQSKSMVTLVREPYIYLKVLKDFYHSSQCKGKAGERRLHRLAQRMDYQTNLIDQHPDIAASMERKINEVTLFNTPVLSASCRGH